MSELNIYTARRESNYNDNHNNNNNYNFDSSRLSHKRYHNRTQLSAQRDDNNNNFMNDDNNHDKSNSHTTVSVNVETANE